MSDFVWLIDSVYAHFIKTPLIVLALIFAAFVTATALLVRKALKERDHDE